MKRIFEDRLVEHFETNPPKKLFFPELKEAVEVHEMKKRETKTSSTPVINSEEIENSRKSKTSNEKTDYTSEKNNLERPQSRSAVNLFDLVKAIDDQSVLRTLKKSVKAKLKMITGESEEICISIDDIQRNIKNIDGEEQKKNYITKLNIMLKKYGQESNE